MSLLKSIITICVILFFISACSVYLANRHIDAFSKEHISSDLTEMPQTKTGLVLGTSKYGRLGNINPYFRYRIDAAAELYHSGKVSYLVVSGDNSRKNYNEPVDMKEELVAKGVPAEVIYLDYAGFRTLDSVVRMKEIFSQSRFIIISQEFHNSRAVYIGRRKGYETYGYNAREVAGRGGLRTNIREKFARVKVFIDVAIGKQPKFLGEKINIGSDQANDI